MDPAAPPSLSSRPWLLGLAVVLVLGALYLWQYLDRGWVPHDEGTLAQSAERVLQGQLPHSDFDDVYTGGLSYWNALAFRVGGVRLTSIRWALFLAFLVWLPAVYFLATRWASIPVALLVTGLAVTLSVPNYSAAIPSWYNLFLATLGLTALVRYLETRSRAWLFVAGMCGGLSILIKIVGLYSVAAVALTLLAWEQSGLGSRGDPEEKDEADGASSVGNRFYSMAVVVGLLAFIAAVFWVFGRTAPLRSIGAYVIPAVVPALLLLERELRMPLLSRRHRIQDLWRLTLPFAAGLLVALVPFAAFYAIHGALADLYRGLFIDPAERLRFAARTFPSLASLWTAIPPAVLLIWSCKQSPRARRWAAGFLLIPLAALLFRSDLITIYQPVFYSFRWVVLIAVVAGALVLRRRWLQAEPSSPSVQSAAALFAFLAGAGLFNLVQFPFAAPIYFLYVAPLGLLALLATSSFRSPGGRPVFVSLVAFYMIFFAVWVNRGFIHWMGIHYYPDSQTEVLEIDRGGLRVSAQDKETYEALNRVIREKARGEFIFATPDCPQVYFLSGYRNPTTTLFDFFDDPENRVRRILETLAERDVNLVVVNHKPEFSDTPPEDLLAALRSGYPNQASIAHFEVRWRP